MKSKPKFSILTLILVVTIFALAAALFSANKKIRDLQLNADALAKLSDAIAVDDSSLVYVRPLNRDAPLTFAYKLALPADQSFKLMAGEGVGESLDLIYMEELSGIRDGFMWQAQIDTAVYLRKKEDCWFIGGGRTMSRPFPLEDRDLGWMEGLSVTSLAWNSVNWEKRDATAYQPNERIYLVDFDENSYPDPFLKTNRAKKPVESARRFAIWLEPKNGVK